MCSSFFEAIFPATKAHIPKISIRATAPTAIHTQVGTPSSSTPPFSNNSVLSVLILSTAAASSVLFYGVSSTRITESSSALPSSPASNAVSSLSVLEYSNGKLIVDSCKIL